MTCSICRGPELATRSDGVKYSPVDSHAIGMVCGKCLYILSQCRAKMDWNMTVDDLKSAYQTRGQLRRTK